MVLNQLKRNDEAKPLVDREIAYLTTTVSVGPFLPEEQRLLYDHLSKAIEKHPIEKVQPVIDQINQHLYPWVFQMASGQLEMRRAWKSRGERKLSAPVEPLIVKSAASAPPTMEYVIV